MTTIPDKFAVKYPPELYHGETGEITASFRSSDNPPNVTRPSIDIGYIATSTQTAGQFGFYRVDFRPNEPSYNPGVPTAHFHKTLSELLFVMSGSMKLFDGENWLDAAPGDSLFASPGAIHGFQHVSTEPA